MARWLKAFNALGHLVWMQLPTTVQRAMTLPPPSTNGAGRDDPPDPLRYGRR
jgi:hypothetical protein